MKRGFFEGVAPPRRTKTTTRNDMRLFSDPKTPVDMVYSWFTM